MSTKKYLFFISQDYSYPVLRPLQEEIRRRGDTIKWFLYGNEIHHEYLHKDEEILDSIEDTVKYKPDAVFVPGNVVPSFISGLKVQVFHGLPSTKAKKNGQLYHFIIRGMFDLYCTQGQSSTVPFQALAKKHQYFTVKETGWSKLDPLYPIISNNQQNKSIFFASTFSPRFSKAKILYPFILEMIQKYPYTWYITLHPKMEKEIVAMYKNIHSPKVIFLETPHMIDGFKNADMMLCDTSSIIYEFLTQLKPVVTFQTQKEEDVLINVTQLDELEGMIHNVLNKTYLQKSIVNYVQKFHPYTDGKSSKRTLDQVEKMLNGKDKARKRKPLNLIRNFKLRKELNYWKF